MSEQLGGKSAAGDAPQDELLKLQRRLAAARRMNRDLRRYAYGELIATLTRAYSGQFGDDGYDAVSFRAIIKSIQRERYKGRDYGISGVDGEPIAKLMQLQALREAMGEQAYTRRVVGDNRAQREGAGA